MEIGMGINIGKCGKKKSSNQSANEIKVELSVGQSSVLMNIGSNWLKFHFLKKKTHWKITLYSMFL